MSKKRIYDFFNGNVIYLILFHIVLSFWSVKYYWEHEHRPTRTAALILLCIFSALISVKKFKQKKTGVLNLLGITGNSKRYLTFDVLRVVAILCAVGTHVIQIDISRGEVASQYVPYFRIIFVTMMVCNPLFVMMSTSLLMKWKDEHVLSFYYRRLTKILIPMFIYYVWYLWQNLQLDDISPALIGRILGNFYTGTTPECPHYWLMYIIVSIYLIVPFFRYMFRKIDYKALTALSLVCLADLFVGTHLDRYAISAIRFPMEMWLAAGIIGYWCTLPETRKWDKYICAAGIVSFVYLCFITIAQKNYGLLCCNTSPAAVSMAASLEVACIRLFDKRTDNSWLLQILCKYGFGIMLIHWWAIHWVNIKQMHLTISQYHYIGGFAQEMLYAVSASLLAAVCLDTVFTAVIQEFFDLIRRFITKYHIGISAGQPPQS